MSYCVLLDLRPEYYTEDDHEDYVLLVRVLDLPFMPTKGHTLQFSDALTDEGELQGLLDRVDARDSLAYLKRRDALRDTKLRAVLKAWVADLSADDYEDYTAAQLREELGAILADGEGGEVD